MIRNTIDLAAAAFIARAARNQLTAKIPTCHPVAGPENEEATLTIRKYRAKLAEPPK